MSEMFSSLELTGLRKAHLRQLLQYVEDRDEFGWYIGDKKRFENRHAQIKSWLKAAVEHDYSGGVVMPGDRRKK